MAEIVLRDQQLWLDKYDITGDMNSITVAYAAEPKDNTTFGGATTRTFIGGIKTVEVSGQGIFNTGALASDDIMFSLLGVQDTIFSVGAEDGVDGSIAYLMPSVLQSTYSPGESVGELLKFDFTTMGAGNFVRGIVGKNGTETVTGDGTAYQQGALSATQKMYASLHVLAASGGSPTLDVIVESDDAGGFPSGVPQITFTQAVATTSETLEVAGALADDWWRVGWTIGGSTPSFTFVVTFGIL